MIGRVWKIFHLLLTFFLLIKKKESFLFIKPIKADEIYYKISELGTSFIKLAQVLATRGDFFSGEYLNELKKVHDSLEAMDKSEVVEILKKSGVWDENFKSSSNFKNSQNFRDSRNFDDEVNFSSQNFDNKNFSGEVSKISALKSSENSKISQNSQTTKNSQNSTKDSNKPLKFAKFDLTPIASASIGQVHIAYLKDGTKLAVKLRRTGIEKRVKQDIKIIKSLNFIFKPLFSTYTKHSIEAVISEFSDMILKEISMSRELLNLEKFSKTYAHLNITFPTPYKELSNDDMLVMSFESGFRFDDTKSVLASGVDIKVVLKKLVLFYVEQMLVKGYFHADPHPGNLLIKKW